MGLVIRDSDIVGHGRPLIDVDRVRMVDLDIIAPLFLLGDLQDRVEQVLSMSLKHDGKPQS